MESLLKDLYDFIEQANEGLNVEVIVYCIVVVVARAWACMHTSSGAEITGD